MKISQFFKDKSSRVGRKSFKVYLLKGSCLRLSRNIFSYICFLVFEVFQVFHLLHVAAIGGWPPAANFTLVNSIDFINFTRKTF